MKHVEAGGKEILLANVDGKFYATSDRCGHMNAMLSMGRLQGTTIICPLHASRFDITTGKNLTDPVFASLPGAEKLPEASQRILKRQKELLDVVKTYDLPTFNVKVEGESIFVDI